MKFFLDTAISITIFDAHFSKLWEHTLTDKEIENFMTD